MRFIDFLFHLINFVLPAVFVGGALALFGPRYGKRTWPQVWLFNSIAGIAAMVSGLILFDVDGKMLSYAFLIVACSLAQLTQQRLGRGRK